MKNEIMILIYFLPVPTSAQLTELFEKKTDSSGDPPENSLVNGGTDKEKDDRRDSEPIVGQKVIHQAELESQLFRVRVIRDTKHGQSFRDENTHCANVSQVCANLTPSLRIVFYLHSFSL